MPRTIFYVNKDVQITIQPNIGLDAGTRQSVVGMLNVILADEAVLFNKTRRAAGLEGGVSTPDLQPLFEAQYQQVKAISDEIIERIQIIGGSSISELDKLIDAARLDGKLVSVPSVLSILADHEAFICFLREDAQKCSEVYEDQGTFALLVTIMRNHEKIAWVLRSNIAPKQLENENEAV